MEASEIALYIGVSTAAAFAVAGTVRLAWRLRSAWRIRRAGPRPLLASVHRIWQEPVESPAQLLRYGPGGRSTLPAPPFQFVEEHLAGSQPCVAVRDARKRL